jgi:hypothetical protein
MQVALRARVLLNDLPMQNTLRLVVRHLAVDREQQHKRRDHGKQHAAEPRHLSGVLERALKSSFGVCRGASHLRAHIPFLSPDAISIHLCTLPPYSTLTLDPALCHDYTNQRPSARSKEHLPGAGKRVCPQNITASSVCLKGGKMNQSAMVGGGEPARLRTRLKELSSIEVVSCSSQMEGGGRCCPASQTRLVRGELILGSALGVVEGSGHLADRAQA